MRNYILRNEDWVIFVCAEGIIGFLLVLVALGMVRP